jgi:endonuclease-3 related protein
MTTAAVTVPERALAETRTLLRIYDILAAEHPWHEWHWREDTPPLVQCLSAILVQHTNWKNVDRALERLDKAGVRSLDAVRRLSDAELAELVRPAGTPLTKARRLKAFAALVAREAGGDLARLLALPAEPLRAKLLATPGIGEETADAIALYSAGKPVFVVDAYTRRLFRRLGLGPAGERYNVWQRWFEERLAPMADGEALVALYRRYHAFIVLHSKRVCRARPLCGRCILRTICPSGRGT